MSNGTPSRAYRPVSLFLLAMCLVGVGQVVYTLDKIGRSVDAQSELNSQIIWGAKMQTVTAKWTSGGTEYEVTTRREEGESPTNFAARHDEVVTAMQALHPPD